MINPKHKITGDQLIGITCGSASVFFIILTAIILIVRKKNKIITYSDFSISSFEVTDENKDVKVEDIKKCNYDSDESDLDFWI